MKTPLNFFDKLMLAVTFAEAGLAAPEYRENDTSREKAQLKKATVIPSGRKHKMIVANG